MILGGGDTGGGMGEVILVEVMEKVILVEVMGKVILVEVMGKVILVEVMGRWSDTGGGCIA